MHIFLIQLIVIMILLWWLIRPLCNSTTKNATFDKNLTTFVTSKMMIDPSCSRKMYHNLIIMTFNHIVEHKNVTYIFATKR